MSARDRRLLPAVIFLFLLAVLIVGLYSFVSPAPAPPLPIFPKAQTPTFVTDKGNADIIKAASPKANDIIASPLTVTGEARGNWYFEATFPARLEDGNGNLLGAVGAHANGEWMTADFVPFTATLSFTAPTSATGTLILEKDNPSDLPQNADALRIPVRFAPETVVGATKADMIRLSSPKPYEFLYGGPLTVEGEARGNWFSEGSLSFGLEDANGLLLGEGFAQAQTTEWMTTNFVKFKGTLKSYKIPRTADAVLVLTNGNESDNTALSDEIRVPLRFPPSMVSTK